jgi:predicted membrane-bound spermidine synthase
MHIKSHIPTQQVNDFEIRNDGDQTQLFNGQQLIMSDRQEESDEHAVFFSLPLHGDILITGLGVGLVNEHLITLPDIDHVVIVEKHKEVIDMVWPHCKRDDRFEIVHADADTWEPNLWTDKACNRFDFAWLDHWTELHDMRQKAWFDFIAEKYSKYCDLVMIWKPSFLAQKQ